MQRLSHFGGVWYYKDSHYWKNDRYWLDWLEEKPFTTLFVDGNHENFDRLYAYPTEKWKGVEIFEIDGKKIFAFGGAASHDISDGILETDEEGRWRMPFSIWRRLTGRQIMWYRIAARNRQQYY